VWRALKVLVLATLVLAVAGELVARFVLGLGDPPLSMSHPDVEYMFRPAQDCLRFGNRVKYNAYSMRSDDFPSRKTNPAELRLLVLGDSVINGGNLTDQADLATEIVKRQLTQQLDRPVVVGNVSAGSWGPDNHLAYIKLYGLFDADIVVLVLSSHDVADMRSFKPLVGVHPGFPDVPPVSALAEGITRYLPRYLPGFGDSSESDKAGDKDGRPRTRDPFPSRVVLDELLTRVRSSGALPILIHHAERAELTGEYKPGRELLADWAADHNVPFHDAAARFRAAHQRGDSPYRDTIHPNPRGQQLLAEELLAAVIGALTEPKTPNPPP
jgi:hypothetical protein